MRMYSIFLQICLVVSTSCLGAGYILGGYWPVMPVLFVIAIFWLVMQKKLSFWSASSLLFLYLLLAAVGVIVNLSLPLMMIGCAAALACWDLTHFGQTILHNLPLETNASLERYRLGSLGTAVIVGLTLAMASSYLNLKFPFLVVAFLALAVIGCLAYGFQYIEAQLRSKSTNPMKYHG